MFTQVAIGAGFPIASPDGLCHDTGRNILNTQVASLSLSQDDPFCLWVSYPDVDPTSDVAAWVHTAAMHHISAGRIAILDARWKFTFGRYNISDELESTSDPLATEGDDFSFAWSQNFGSNSGRILSDLEAERNSTRPYNFQPSTLSEQKVREVFDSMLQESDLRS